MEKGKKEYVPECAQRWREKAIQVDPLLLEKEIINLFSNTFKAFFFHHLVGSPTQHFMDIIIVAEWLEKAIRARKITNLTKMKGVHRKETEHGYK